MGKSEEQLKKKAEKVKAKSPISPFWMSKSDSLSFSFGGVHRDYRMDTDEFSV